VFAWTRFIRPTSFISSIDWISSYKQQRNAAFRAHHTHHVLDRGKKIHILGRKFRAHAAHMDHLATHMRPPAKGKGAYLVLFDFVGDLLLTLLYGVRTLLINPLQRLVLNSHELFTKLDAISTE
jgi:hypothetical protein